MRRLLLFDIDGTLISGGPAKEAFHRALLETFGTAGAIEVHDFAGKTDPQIARELLAKAGVATSAIDTGLPLLFERYLDHLEDQLPERPVRVLDGVVALLDALSEDAAVGLGLLTGNHVRGAELKLRSAGIEDRFVMGSYGSDHEERDALPAIALRRAEETWGVRFAPSDVWVIGDTPRDVQCGRKERMRTLGVASGRYGAHHLRAAGADRVVPDLRDTVAVTELLLA